MTDPPSEGDGPFSEEDVAALIEGMRARGELGYKSEEE